MNHFHAYVIALMLLSRIPVPARWMPANLTQTLQTLSVLYFPVVGLTLGLILVLVQPLAAQVFPPLFSAALLLAVWVWLTGALHLDGLADCIDVLAASHKTEYEPQRLLAIFKEPTIGVMAAVGLIVLLLLKFAALFELLQQGRAGWLLFILVWPRSLVMVYMLTTARVRAHGLTADAELKPRSENIYGVCALVFAVSLLLWPTVFVLAGCALSVLLLFWWRRLWLKKIGGFAGDCLGGFVEMAELILLVCAIAQLGGVSA